LCCFPVYRHFLHSQAKRHAVLFGILLAAVELVPLPKMGAAMYVSPRSQPMNRYLQKTLAAAGNFVGWHINAALSLIF
jgi:hypothetical protein